MKHQFILAIPLLLIVLLCAFYAPPRISFANMGALHSVLVPLQAESRGTRQTAPKTEETDSAPVEIQPGVTQQAGEGEGEPENKEGVQQTDSSDIQEHARKQAERNQRDIEQGNPTPDRPATPANLAAYHAERDKTAQEDQQTADAKRSQQENAQTTEEGGEGGDL